MSTLSFTDCLVINRNSTLFLYTSERVGLFFLIQSNPILSVESTGLNIGFKYSRYSNQNKISYKLFNTLFKAYINYE